MLPTRHVSASHEWRLLLDTSETLTCLAKFLFFFVLADGRTAKRGLAVAPGPGWRGWQAAGKFSGLTLVNQVLNATLETSVSDLLQNAGRTRTYFDTEIMSWWASLSVFSDTISFNLYREPLFSCLSFSFVYALLFLFCPTAFVSVSMPSLLVLQLPLPYSHVSLM